VIDPKTGTVLGTIALGNPRLDTDADVLGPMYDRQIDVHGLGFSRDGRYIDVIDVTTNAVHVIDTATNAVVHTIYLNRAPHERFTVYLTRGRETTALLSATTNNMGNMEEAVAFLHFFANHYDKVIVRPGAPSS